MVCLLFDYLYYCVCLISVLLCTLISCSVVDVCLLVYCRYTSRLQALFAIASATELLRPVCWW